MLGLALWCLAQGWLNKAEDLLITGLERSEEAFGREHQETLWYLSSLASIYHCQHRLKEAEVLVSRAMRILGNHEEDDYSYLIKLRDHTTLAMINWRRERLEDAETHAMIALRGFEKKFGLNALEHC